MIFKTSAQPCPQLIVCGLGKIDIADWKSNTRLKHCTLDSNIVKWFWKAVESYDEERRARLLQFVTGSSRVPLQGFKALQGGCEHVALVRGQERQQRARSVNRAHRSLQICVCGCI